MIIKLAFSNNNLNDKLEGYCKENNIDYISFNEEFFKDRKKAFKLKGSCGARLSPFCAIYKDENTLIKAFYTEAGECTFNNIKSFINEINSRE